MRKAVTNPVDDLVALLDLEQIEQNLFRAYHPAGRTGRLYGGQIMAQALMAAARTISQERAVHSLHGYFLRPGDTYDLATGEAFRPASTERPIARVGPGGASR